MASEAETVSPSELAIMMPFFLSANVHEPQLRYHVLSTYEYPGVAEINGTPMNTSSVDQFLQHVNSAMTSLPQKVQIIIDWKFIAQVACLRRRRETILPTPCPESKA
jgi:hypothetical protein